MAILLNGNTNITSGNKHLIYGLMLFVFMIAGSFFLLSFDYHDGNESISEEQVSYKIEWVGVYPSPDEKNKKGFKEKIADVILGKKGTYILKPFGVFVENPDKYWVIDQGTGTVFRISGNKSTIPEVLRKQRKAYFSLAGLCIIKGNKLLFTESSLNKIFEISENGKKINVFNDSLKLQQPTGIAWSKKKNEVWVVETKAHRIAVLNREGSLLKYIGKRGTGPGEFNYPAFIWIDDNGDVYVVDSMNFRIQILDSEGNFITSFGKAGDASGYFARPKGVATDSHGNIYVADALYNVIQVFNRKGELLYYFGSQGHGEGQFWMPAGIFIDKNDFIYVADTYNARIQIFKLTEK